MMHGQPIIKKENWLIQDVVVKIKVFSAAL